MIDNFADFTRRASVPEHLEHYVRALGPCTPTRFGTALGWRSGGNLILVCFPLDMAVPTEEDRNAMNQAVAMALKEDWLERLTVLAPFRPEAAPENAALHEDEYWALDLPVAAPRGKLVNMLRRAAGCVDISVSDTWTEEHDKLVSQVSARLREKQGAAQLSEDSGLLFSRIGKYVETGGNRVCCYSARRHDSGELCGLAVADHASYQTSFYLFAFRNPDAPPGTADALLKALLDNSAFLGQQSCNLGLGIHSGIHFFKKKWGARPVFKSVECSWDKPKVSFFSRLGGLFGRRG